MGSAREVIVYSTPFCAPCEQMKRYLTAQGVPFRVRDLLMDEEAEARLAAHNIRSTPAIEIDGEIYAGETLTPERLKALLDVP